jgi:hypothetical protein
MVAPSTVFYSGHRFEDERDLVMCEPTRRQRYDVVVVVDALFVRGVLGAAPEGRGVRVELVPDVAVDAIIRRSIRRLGVIKSDGHRRRGPVCW